MNTKALLEASLFLQIGIGVTVLATIILRRAYRVFPQLTVLLGVMALEGCVSLLLLFFRKYLHLSIGVAYPVLFYSTWIFGAVSCLLRILIIYSVFAEAMRPLSGLHQAGKLIFRWVAVVSGLVAFALVAGPGVFSSLAAFGEVFGHLQQGVSVLTICLLVFVCFAVRPLGLTFRSHLFGVSLGLGVMATVELVQAAWMVTSNGQSLYSPVYLFSSVGFSASLVIWGVYFGAPEPARKMILLPTTSPFFFWNRISEILGDAPGHVAVAGFSPNMLAPAEIEMLTAATAGEAADAAEAASQAAAPVRTHTKHLPSVPEFTGVRHPSLAL